MNLLDMRTVVISYGISDLICMIVMAVLWRQNRRKFAGLGFWLANFVLQFIALVFLALRGVVPDLLSVTGSNATIIGGAILLYIGLEHFTEKRGSQLHNYILLAAIILVQPYFVYILPSLRARIILFSLALMAICAQGAWLMLRRVDPKSRSSTSGVGHVMVVFCLVSIARLIVDLAVPSSNDFFHSNAYDALVLMAYQMLFILLMLSLFMMVNHRLSEDVENDIVVRKRAEAALMQAKQQVEESEARFRQSLEFSPIPIALADSKGRLTFLNKQFVDTYGYTPQDIQTIEQWFVLAYPDSEYRAAVLQQWQMDVEIAVKDNAPTQVREYQVVCKTGEVKTVEVSAYFEGDLVIGLFRDITERRQMELELRAEKAFTERALDAQQDTFFVFSLSTGKAIRWNKAFRDISGYTDEEISRLKAPDAYYVQEDLEIAAQATKEILEKGSGAVELEFICKDGRRIPFEYVASIMYSDSGEPENFISIGRDITERKQAEEIVRMRLRLWEYAGTHSIDELMQKALDEVGDITGSPIGFYHFVEEDQNTLSLQAWSTRTLTEFCQAEGKGLHYPIDKAGVWVDCVRERKPVIHNDYASLPHRKGMPAGHAEVIRELVVPVMRNEKIVAILGVGNKPADYDNKDVELISYIADVTWTIVEQKQANEKIIRLNGKLEQLAMTDELTGLFNRRLFFQRGAEEIRRSQRYHTHLSLLMMDIDGFKTVNDTYGHDAGDQILRCLADVLQHHIRDVDTLARLGGEEFSILLPNTEGSDAVKLADRLRLEVERTTCSLQNHRRGVTMSIGVATYEKDIRGIDYLLKNADTAMYRAKNQGRNCVVLYT